MQQHNTTLSRRAVLKSLMIIGASPFLLQQKQYDEQFQFLGLGSAGTTMMLEAFSQNIRGKYFVISDHKYEGQSPSVNFIQTNFSVSNYSSRTLAPELVNHINAKTTSRIFGTQSKCADIILPNHTKVMFLGLGGFTGSSLCLSLAKHLKETNQMFSIISSLPFGFEGRRKKEFAVAVQSELKQHKGFRSYNNEVVRNRYGNCKIEECFKNSDKYAVDIFRNFN